jgi:hypothetical protein
MSFTTGNPETSEKFGSGNAEPGKLGLGACLSIARRDIP